VEAVADNPASTPARTLGQTLAAERERQGLSRADVAQRLHMSAYQVEAIETGDYARLPQGTFLRGFVRNYAKALGIAADPLLALLSEGAAPKQRPGIVVPTESIRFDPTGEGLRNPYVKAAGIAFVVIALAFAAMYWWLFIRPAPPGAAAQKPAPAIVASAQQTYMPAPAPAPIEPAPQPAPPVEAAPQKEPEPAKKAQGREEDTRAGDTRARIRESGAGQHAQVRLQGAVMGGGARQQGQAPLLAPQSPRQRRGSLGQAAVQRGGRQRAGSPALLQRPRVRPRAAHQGRGRPLHRRMTP
jgi:cytoskeletal protein RodZ